MKVEVETPGMFDLIFHMYFYCILQFLNVPSMLCWKCFENIFYFLWVNSSLCRDEDYKKAARVHNSFISRSLENDVEIEETFNIVSIGNYIFTILGCLKRKMTIRKRETLSGSGAHQNLFNHVNTQSLKILIKVFTWWK